VGDVDRALALVLADPLHRFARHPFLIRRRNAACRFGKRLVSGDRLDLVRPAYRFSRRRAAAFEGGTHTLSHFGLSLSVPD
jgi:hypothetical protein